MVVSARLFGVVRAKSWIVLKVASAFVLLPSIVSRLARSFSNSPPTAAMPPAAPTTAAPPPTSSFAPAPAIDYEVGNWYTSQHPASHFRHQLIAARTTDEARYGLRDNRLTIRRADGGIDQRHLSADAIEAALRDIFLLTPEPGWRRVIERAAAAEVVA